MKGFTWDTHEYVQRVKSRDWYWTVGIITGALIILCFIFGNPLFAIILAISVFTLTIFSVREPRIINIVVNDKGVKADKVFYPFNALEAYGIDNEHMDGPRLLLKSKKVIMPLISIPVQEHDLEDISAFLKQHLKEEQFDQGLLHTLLERLGF